MRRRPSLLALALLAGACANIPADNPRPEPEVQPKPAIVGGYSPASMDDELVKQAKAVAIDEIYKRNPTRALVEKATAEQQVVAGMNYRFHIEMSGGAKFEIVVFNALDGKMSVTSYEKVG